MIASNPGRLGVAFLFAIVPLVSGARGGADEPDPRRPFGAEALGLMSELESASIREELKITPEQFADLRRQAVAVEGESSWEYGHALEAERSHRLFGYSHHEYHFTPSESDAWLAWRNRLNAAVKRVLTDSQYRRLEQIEHQRATDLDEVTVYAMKVHGEQFTPRTLSKYQKLERLREDALACLSRERDFALRRGIPDEEVEQLVAEKKRQLHAAYYARLLPLLTRDQRRRWAEHIGKFYRATGDEAKLEPTFGEVYFALLLSRSGTVELPLDPYLALPGGRTTGQDYPEFPRGRTRRP